MVNTRSTTSKLLDKERLQQANQDAPSCAGSQVKSEPLVKIIPPSHSSRHSAKSKVSSSLASIESQKKKLELEAAKTKARIQMELIDKQLAVDIAELNEEYSPALGASKSSNSVRSDVKKWVEQSQNELEMQQAMTSRNEVDAKVKQQTSDIHDTNGPVQQLATALRQIVTTSTTQNNSNLLSRLGTPRDLPSFYGNPIEWLQFKQAYIESTTVCSFTDQENMWRLRKCLRGPAYDAVAALLITATSPAVIMSTLELQFGNSDCIISRIMTDIKRMNNISTDYHKEIIAFSIKVKNYVAAVRALGREEYLQGMEVAAIVLSKLPTSLVSKWTDYSYPIITSGSPKSRLDLLSDFLTDEAVKTSTCSPSLLQSKTEHFKRRQEKSTDYSHAVLLTDDGGGSSQQKCSYCRINNHNLPECKKFRKALRKDRWRHVKRYGICYKCLVSTHRKESCPAASCDLNNCGESHHKLLHFVPSTKSVTVPALETEPVITESVINIYNNSAVLLKVIPINICGPNGVMIKTTALLDDGSTVTLISSSLAAQAGLQGRRDTLSVQGAWENTKLVCETEIVNFEVYSLSNSKFNISARVITNLNLPKNSLKAINCNNFKYLESISHNLCTEALQPQILIGQDNCHLLLSLESKIGKPYEPCATRTPLGWCLHGRVPVKVRGHDYALHITNEVSETDIIRDVLREIQEEVRKSLTIESIGISAKPRLNSEDVRAQAILERTSVLIDGQWQVGLPWKDETLVMPDSYPTAMLRLKSVEQKMTKNNAFAQRYKDRVNHLFQNYYATQLYDLTVTPKTWYLPHFGVDNPNKNKLRLVFDAAAKTEGLALNDYLLKGPDLLISLFGIMLRFRENPIAVSGDIKDMFLRVKIRPEDQNAFRFLYRDQPEGPVNTYRMSSLIFGANCSPFIAQFIKNKNAQQYISTKPTAVAAIQKQHYMDDYIDSMPNETIAIKLIHDVTLIHKRGNFEIRNWTSNSQTVLQTVPKNCLGKTAVKFKIGQQHEGERTLGLIWHPSDDTLRFDVSFKRINQNIINGTKIPTKREMLSVLMSIFDVYGFLSPFTIIGKIILQETWNLKISWDDCVTNEINNKWLKWIKLLEAIRHVRLPRYYPVATAPTGANETEAKPLLSQQPEQGPRVVPAMQSYTNLQLHVFCDSSTKAMCAVAYWRWLDCSSQLIRVAFITSRSRVAPVKPMSVPRLELQAALLGVRLAKTIVEEHRIKPLSKTFWCDSSTVLTWIRNKARNYKQFVAHRLGEIDELSDLNEWRYVPTKLNVADIATRESYDKLVFENEWLYGPKFLSYTETDWPSDFFVEPVKKELDLEFINVIETNNLENYLPTPDVTRFSSWLRLLRSTAIVLRFIDKCRKVTYQFDDSLDRAELLLLKQSQLRSYKLEIVELKNNRSIPRSSKILNLSPYLDENGILRVGGRIGVVTGVRPETKNPVILDGSCHVARLIVRYYHHYFAHGNQETVLNEIKQKYWIGRLRPTIKTVSSRCITCRMRKSKPEVPRMGDLPVARVAHHQRPFTYCGVDLFGPMEVTVGRRREKRYGVLFTCLTVRAIHLEVVVSLTSDSFIMALRRMAARRGWPQYLYSDNGTNLRGANAELKRSVQDFDEELLKSEALNHGTKWTFIPPASPHWGGAWERLIRSVKTTLKAILKERAPKDETLNTLLAEVENIVNSRPLTHVSVDSKDCETLTPNHFLIGSSSSLPHIGVFDDTELHLRKQWRIAQRLADMYWRRWVREILPDMLPRTKWQSEHKNLQVGDLVLVVDPDLPRNMWPKGLVQVVVPGTDGRVRVVKIKTKSGLLTRSASRVARISLDNN